MTHSYEHAAEVITGPPPGHLLIIGAVVLVILIFYSAYRAGFKPSPKRGSGE